MVPLVILQCTLCVFLSSNINIPSSANAGADGGARTGADAQTDGNVTIEVQGNLENTGTADPTAVAQVQGVSFNFNGFVAFVIFSGRFNKIIL